jgi:hypothetical protein
MNGLSEDVIGILKNNLMYHNKSIGYIQGISSDGRMGNLLDDLYIRGLQVTGIKEDVPYDYIVISRKSLNARVLLKSLTSIAKGGIIILEITGREVDYMDKYGNITSNFYGTKVIYGDRSYLILHLEFDYGN